MATFNGKICILLAICTYLTPVAINARSQFKAQAQSVSKPSSSSSAKDSLLKKPTSNVIITMSQPMSNIISTFSTMTKTFRDRESQVSALVSTLKATATASQASVMTVLSAFNVKTESYWLTNQIYVEGASPRVIRAVMGVNGVKDIKEDEEFKIFFPFTDTTTGDRPSGIQWNVKKIGAHKLWDRGIEGEGILVAGIDTGVRATHQSIKDNYIGTSNHGWYDPIWGTPEPTDIQGHGTHTVGTIVGKDGIGAAPKAKWMACRGCGLQSCMQHAVIACGQYILCPSNPHGQKQNCTNVPHIVNNSWGGQGGTIWYEDVIAAWKAAGIIPFFAIGNNGPDCETAASPGDNDWVISVGATDREDKLAKFSSRGPKIKMVNLVGDDTNGVLHQMMSLLGQKREVTDFIKPDISAPGHEIFSAGILSDDSYKKLSGTSMATPLAAGAAALLLSKNPDLTMDDMKNLMYNTAVRDLPKTFPICGSTPEDQFPNNMYGHGRLDIYKAYKKMVRAMKEKLKQKKEEETEGDEDEKIENTTQEGATEATATTGGTAAEGGVITEVQVAVEGEIGEETTE